MDVDGSGLARAMRMSAIRHALPLRALVVAAALTVAWDCMLGKDFASR
jgi:hypothetical protein